MECAWVELGQDGNGEMKTTVRERLHYVYTRNNRWAERDRENTDDAAHIRKQLHMGTAYETDETKAPKTERLSEDQIQWNVM